ncbi:1,4-dihydroxy-2-naphthoate prenyltransferase [Gelidibacter algens]|uniref:1,4-dihydroxy-2-naphthoate octaprenyltransferase n=1 Tax=Gelidibacter algens TaxID=49280 RepID=A0A1A7QZC0_9FLAO|nr:1,4-dihydroxy-2-naphthoate octaprenyltransferase [Gelidibacter algens]OBX24916.1 1,4-dihydroxy-2-naphthoate octaprenyltransferase [Gelidibacter algens]RAJ27567.1 1,4-dihydroxy-2-naphthoate prenyltransferase [Gelidibacter algens]
MDRLKPWLSAFRLRTLPLSISGIIIGSCFAAYNGFFNPIVFVLALLVTVALQILSNLANDYGDGVKGTDNETRVGPMRAIQSGKITPDQMFEGLKINILIVIFLTVLLIYNAFGHGYFLYSLLFFGLGAISVYAALKYTMGDSAYGYKGLGDVFVLIFFGFVSVVGSYFLYTKQLDHIVVLPSIAVGLLSVGVLNLNNMRDIASDKISRKITMAVKLGKVKSKQYHLFLVISAMGVGVVFAILYYTSLYNFIFLLSYIPLTIHIIKISKATISSDFDSQLKVLALSTFLFSLLLGIGYIL